MERQVLYLSRGDVESLRIPINEVVRVLESAFEEKGEGTIEQPLELGVHLDRGAHINAMPAYIQKMGAVGLKWLSVFPDNYKKGLPYIQALVVLNDTETGTPLAIMDSTWITENRTGAATVIAAKLLARKNSQVFGIVGCGIQGRSNLRAIVKCLGNITEVKAYDTSPAVLEKYLSDASKDYGLKATRAETPREAVRGSDIVVTAVPLSNPPTPVIEDEWLDEGGFACPLDLGTSWKPSAMRGVDKFYTDDTSQMAHLRTAGFYKDVPETDGEISEIIIGRKPGRENDKERIMSMMLGIGMEDIATAHLIFEKAKKENRGTWLKL